MDLMVLKESFHKQAKKKGRDRIVFQVYLISGSIRKFPVSKIMPFPLKGKTGGSMPVSKNS